MRRDSGVGFMRLLGFVAMFHGNAYISLLVSFVDIPMSLDNLFQRIRSIYNWSWLFLLNKVFEVNQIFSLNSC
jgi:hypothetical protein